MKSILFALTLSALLFAASAQYDAETTSFLAGPTQVLNSSTDADTFQYPFVGRYINSTYFALWGFSTDSDQSPYTYSAVRRLINTTDLSIAGSDTNLTFNFTFTSTPVFASSTNGFIAVAGVSQNSTQSGSNSAAVSTNGTTTTASTTQTTTNTTTGILVYVFSSDIEGNPNTEIITIGGTTNSSLGYNIYSLFFSNGYFYIVYTVTLKNADNAVFLAGFKADGTLKFTAPLVLNTVDLTGNGNIQAGVSADGNTVAAAWKQSTQGAVVYVEVDTLRANVGSEQTVATDSGNNKFFPAAVVFSDVYYVILVSQQVGGLSTGLTLSVSGSVNTTAAASLGFALGTGYTTYNIAATSGYYDSWFVIAHQEKSVATIVTGSEDDLTIYNYTAPASANASNATNTSTSTSSVLVTDGTVIQGFTLPNQSYYVLILDSETGETGNWKGGYIGQVLNQISANQFGSTMKFAFATLSAVIAMLFVF